MKKNIQLKKLTSMVIGELPDTKSLRMTRTDMAELRARHRSPFGFCKAKLVKG